MVNVPANSLPSGQLATYCNLGPYPGQMNGLLEIQGKSESQSLWALLFPYHLPVRSNEDLKIVWRMTGSGIFSVLAQYNRLIITPMWGPDAHGGSSWDRPGYEWGTGFNFPESGCWHIVATRGNDSGSIDLLVVDPLAIEIF